MNQVKCVSCNFDNPPGQASCNQCGTVLTQTPVDASNDAAEQLRRINESIAALNAEMLDKFTPARTTSFNGCGIMLLDYRPVEDGNYEATRWITVFGFPIIPLSVWKIRPIKYSQDARGERQSFHLLDKQRITLSRFFRPYLFLALGALPFVLAYYFVDLRRPLYYLGRVLGTWLPVALTILLICLILAWIGYIMTRFHNADKAYKQKAP